MNRRLLALLLTLCMVLSMVPATAFADGDNTLNGDIPSVGNDVTSGSGITMSSGPDQVENTTPNAIVSKMSPMVLTQEEHNYMCWPSGSVDVTIDRPLDIVMMFKANDTLADAQASAFGKWICDFYITVTGTSNGAIETDNCYLAGNYGSYGWIVIPMDDVIVEEGVTYPVVSSYDANLTYENICDYVKEFIAAIHLSDEILEENPNLKVTLELRMKNPENADDIFTVGEPYAYTVADLLGMYVSVTKSGNVIKRYEKIEEAIEALNLGEVVGDTIELLTNAAISESINVTGELTINGNGHSLSSSAQRAIRVTGSNANLTLDNVNVSAKNNAIRVEESAEGAVVNVSGSALTGLSVVNVRAPRASVMINGGRITCNDQNESENYGALTIVPTATNAQIVATGVTFDIQGDSFKGMNNADGGVLTIDGSETDVKKDVAIIEYADGGIYSFSALQGAVDYAKPGETVKLIRDITLTENLTISGSAILNVNGKNVTGKFELQDGATLTAVAGLDVITNVEGKAVSYNGTAYVLVDGYKVTFNSNSGSAVAAVNVVSGTAVSAPANPTRTGYTFGGWYTDEACTNAYNFETLVTGDITLYAKWTQNQTSRPSSKPTTTAPTTPSEPTISTDDKTEENAAGDKVTTTETTVKPETTVTGSTAKTEISESVADKIVEEATKSESSSVVIAPEVSETKDVDKVEVTIAASTVDKIGNDTTANLTVSTPVADVAISNEGLTELAGEKEAVTVSAEKKEDDTITVEVKSGDKAVSNVSGGLTVTVPVEETSAGMVAVIVHEDGTEEVVRQTVAGDDALEIPLDGSATIKIVDNSKDFEDVNEDDWHNDAVDFASSRELFNGTSATTFGPTENMTRGMLAVVLHNLESNPEHEHEEDFHDVHDQRYYADAVAWAAGEGLVSGYGNGAYGPDDHITRQQLAVILWKYAGCPDSDHELDFHDEADIADYAEAALKWANEHKIINGKGEGKLDPTGNATRAEVAQMLKNFMENVK